MIRIRTQFDRDEDKGIDFRKKNPKTGVMEFDPGLTKQADKDSCDVNKILERFERTGMLPDMIRSDARYGDFSTVPTYQEACDIVLKAQEQFEALSAHVRDRFSNDPARMLEFCSDPRNAEEMVKLGLAVAKPTVPQPATPSSQPASTDSGAGKSGSPAAGA